MTILDSEYHKVYKGREPLIRAAKQFAVNLFREKEIMTPEGEPILSYVDAPSLFKKGSIKSNIKRLEWINEILKEKHGPEFTLVIDRFGFDLHDQLTDDLLKDYITKKHNTDERE